MNNDEIKEILKVAKAMVATEPWAEEGQKAIKNNMAALQSIIDAGQLVLPKVQKKYADNLNGLYHKATNSFEQKNKLAEHHDKPKFEWGSGEEEKWRDTPEGKKWLTTVAREEAINQNLEYPRLGFYLKNIPECLNMIGVYTEKSYALPGQKEFFENDPESKKLQQKIREFLTSWIPVHNLIVESEKFIQQKVTKKSLKEQENKNWLKPHQSTETLTKVRQVLEDVIQEHYGEMLKSLEEQEMRALETVNGVVDKWNTYGFEGSKGQQAWRKFSDKNISMFIKFEFQKVVERNEEWNQTATPPVREITMTVKSDAESIVKGIAKEMADTMKMNYVIKNMAKLSTITSEKEKKSGAKITSLKAKGGFSFPTFKGTLYFEFSDGTKFIVINKGVFVVNQHNTEFYRYPTTFHNVVFPDKTEKAMVPEREMVEQWSKA